MKKIMNYSMIGITIGLFTSILFSLLFERGEYFPTSSISILYSLNLDNIIIFIICVLSWAVIGILYGLLSKIYDYIDINNIYKNLILHYTLSIILTLFSGLLLGWFPFKIVPIVVFILIFTVIYLIIWNNNRLKYIKEIEEINEKLKN